MTDQRVADGRHGAGRSDEHVQTPRARTAAGLTHKHDSANPLDSASWLSRVSLWWINPLIRRGYAQPLEQDDVWDLPATDTSHVLQRAFDGYYAQHKEKLKTKNHRDPSSLLPSIRGAMWKATSGT
ncbi:hypothetical protein Gpo141_00014316, partial [Globisporangium polare]